MVRPWDSKIPGQLINGPTKRQASIRPTHPPTHGYDLCFGVLFGDENAIFEIFISLFSPQSQSLVNSNRALQSAFHPLCLPSSRSVLEFSHGIICWLSGYKLSTMWEWDLGQLYFHHHHHRRRRHSYRNPLLVVIRCSGNFSLLWAPHYLLYKFLFFFSFQTLEEESTTRWVIIGGYWVHTTVTRDIYIYISFIY